MSLLTNYSVWKPIEELYSCPSMHAVAVGQDGCHLSKAWQYGAHSTQDAAACLVGIYAVIKNTIITEACIDRPAGSYTRPLRW
jgi:hypothetical protein